jgi:hypothetical protein
MSELETASHKHAANRDHMLDATRPADPSAVYFTGSINLFTHLPHPLLDYTYEPLNPVVTAFVRCTAKNAGYLEK